MKSQAGTHYIFQNLNHLIQDDKLPHSLLFAGRFRDENKKNAQAFSQSLLCSSCSNLLEACGECSSCLKVSGLQHENILSIVPEKGVIKIEIVSEILNFLKLKPTNRYQFIFIEDIHLMNIQTANALLKSIEEPPKGSFFIATTQSSSSLLPTLNSRFYKINLPLPTYKDQIKFYKDLNFDEFQFCSGDLEQINRFSDGSMKEALLKSQSFWKKICERSEEAFLDLEEIFRKKDVGIEWVHLWKKLLLYSIKFHGTNDSLDHSRNIKLFGFSFDFFLKEDISTLSQWVFNIHSLEESLSFNLNPLLSAEVCVHKLLNF